MDRLLNVENPWNGVAAADAVEGPCEPVSAEEVAKALRSLKKGKSAGPSGITTEMIQLCEDETAEALRQVAQNMLNGGQMPKSWHKSTMVPIFNGKGSPLECNNYRGIKLLEHGMKVVEKIWEQRLRQIVDIEDAQFGFMPGRGTTDAIFILRQLIEKYNEGQKDLYMIFVDLEKAFDRVPRSLIRWALRRKGVPERLVTAILAMYNETETSPDLGGSVREFSG